MPFLTMEGLEHSGGISRLNHSNDQCLVLISSVDDWGSVDAIPSHGQWKSPMRVSYFIEDFSISRICNIFICVRAKNW